jgi:hypothetical protein
MVDVCDVGQSLDRNRRQVSEARLDNSILIARQIVHEAATGNFTALCQRGKARFRFMRRSAVHSLAELFDEQVAIAAESLIA